MRSHAQQCALILTVFCNNGVAAAFVQNGKRVHKNPSRHERHKQSELDLPGKPRNDFVLEASLGDRHDTDDTTTRRHCLSLIFHTGLGCSATVVGASSSAAAAADACNQGQLVLEQAVPGAYENPCMQLPLRRVPIQYRAWNGDHGGGRLVQAVLEIQQGAVGSGSTGLAVWNSSLVLVRLLQALQIRDPSLFAAAPNSSPLTVVELGCGTGLASLVLARMGTTRVLATDGNPSVVATARANVERQQTLLPPGAAAAPVVDAQLLPWGLLDAVSYADEADWVVGSDLTYNPGSWRALAETMETVLKPNGSVVYLTLGHTGFNVNAEIDGFLAVAGEQGLVPVQPSSPTWPFPQTPEDLQRALLKEVLVTPDERAVVAATGGVRVLVLQKKQFVKAGLRKQQRTT